MPGITSRLRSFWRGITRSAEMDGGISDEFRFHIAARAEDLIRAGMPPREAARRARLEFGSTETYREEVREARGLRGWDELIGESRHTVRALARAPGLAFAGVMMLAIGVGANAAVFSLVSATLFRPLPFPEPERLVVLEQTRAAPGAEPRPFRWWTYPQFAALQSRLGTLSSVAAYWAADANLAAGSEDPVRVRVEMASPSYFPLLGVEAIAGRTLLAEDDSPPGASPVTVIGHDLWQQRFGGSQAVLGQTVVLNGVALTIIGIAEPGFRGLSGDAELWVSHAMAPQIHMRDYLTTDQYFLGVVGRLSPGTSIETAAAEFTTAGTRAAAAVRNASAAEPSETTWGTALVPLDDARRDDRTLEAQLVLAGAAVLVLLLGIVNLGALLLVRSIGRSRETAVRIALGAGRLRLVRHGLVEGGMIGLAGGIAGMLLALWSVPALMAFAPAYLGGARPQLSVAGLASFTEPRMDWRVLGFAAAVALLAGLLAGVIPALRGTRVDVTQALKTGARGSSAGIGSLRRPTLLTAAAVVQVAFALVLLVGAGLLLDSFQRLRTVDAGFDPDGVITFRVSPPGTFYSREDAPLLLENILTRVDAVPGVQYASVGCAPYAGCGSTNLHIHGSVAGAEPHRVGWHYVGPDHFRTLGVPVLRGRSLDSRDRAGQPLVVVINQTAAERFWPGEDPIGRHVGFGYGGFARDSLVEIVGVAADVLHAAPGEEIQPALYTSYLQHSLSSTTVIVRAAGDPSSLIPGLRAAVNAVDPNLAIHDVRTMSQRADDALTGERFATISLSVFAALGLLLASLGVYGVMAYSVAQRRREIGIRLALGSRPHDVLRLIMRQGLALAVAGLGIGVAASVGVGRALPALVSGVDAIDPRVYAVAVTVLLAVAVFACYAPSRSAIRVDPMETITTD